MLPAIDNEIACKRLPSFTYKILPPYSPILLGVFNDKANPLNTDLYALKKGILSKGLSNTCHFRASSPQFKNANKITSQNFQAILPKGASLMSSKDSCLLYTSDAAD